MQLVCCLCQKRYAMYVYLHAQVTLLDVSCYLMMVLVGTRVVVCQVDFEYVCLLRYRMSYFTSMKKANLDKSLLGSVSTLCLIEAIIILSNASSKASSLYGHRRLQSRSCKLKGRQWILGFVKWCKFQDKLFYENFQMYVAYLFPHSNIHIITWKLL